MSFSIFSTIHNTENQLRNDLYFNSSLPGSLKSLLILPPVEYASNNLKFMSLAPLQIKESSEKKLSVTNLVSNKEIQRRHACPYPGCNKTFTRNASVTRHLKVHTGEKSFVCAFSGCAKAFHEASQLTRHQQTHKQF
eukprot:c19390_g3_i2.p1 GENE.c19390_g3_i2~~c19390_g3_i2.p1  ORF type:complete len:137 (-),score=21.28 c19390_g3_i2:278-688(-)